MAADWIKMRTNLTRDPRVSQIAAGCSVSRNEILGALFRLWSIADEQTTDGFLVGATPEWIDAQVGVAGFTGALQKIDRKSWIRVLERGIRVPRFHEHCSQTAKQRALTAKRMKRKRDAGSVTESSPEKRREDKKKKKTPPTPPQGIDWAEDDRLADDLLEFPWPYGNPRKDREAVHTALALERLAGREAAGEYLTERARLYFGCTPSARVSCRGFFGDRIYEQDVDDWTRSGLVDEKARRKDGAEQKAHSEGESAIERTRQKLAEDAKYIRQVEAGRKAAHAKK